MSPANTTPIEVACRIHERRILAQYLLPEHFFIKSGKNAEIREKCSDKYDCVWGLVCPIRYFARNVRPPFTSTGDRYGKKSVFHTAPHQISFTPLMPVSTALPKSHARKRRQEHLRFESRPNEHSASCELVYACLSSRLHFSPSTICQQIASNNVQKPE